MNEVTELLLVLGGRLFLTLLVEFLLAYLLKIKNPLDFLMIFAINCITNPLINMLILIVSATVPTELLIWLILLILELIVVAGEAWFYRLNIDSGIHPLFLSVVLNAGSFLAGLLLLLF